MAGRVGLVTDSTANLTPQRARTYGIEVVPLSVAVGDTEYAEGTAQGAEAVASALRRGPRVSTSRPSPGALLAVYERLAAAGATEIVSAHLSGQLSGTCEAATLAARESPVPVHVVDTRSVGLGLGYAVMSAAQLGRGGASAVQLVQTIRDRGADTRIVLYVHTLEDLRRGGRIGAASALLGSALAVKPVLALVDGHVEPVEKVRTTGRAVARLVDLAAHAVRVADEPVRVAVQHVDAAARAEHIASAITAELDDGRGNGSVPVEIAELTAVLATHLGPGTVAVVVAPGDDLGSGADSDVAQGPEATR